MNLAAAVRGSMRWEEEEEEEDEVIEGRERRRAIFLRFQYRVKLLKNSRTYMQKRGWPK